VKKVLLKKLILLLIIGILFAASLPLSVSAVRINQGLKNPKEVDKKDSSYLRSGTVVTVAYECAFDGYVTFTNGGTDYPWAALKLCGKDEYIYVRGNDRKEMFWKGIPFFQDVKHSEGFVPEKTFYFTGLVEKIKEGDKEHLLEKMEAAKDQNFGVPNTPENSNFEYMIQYVEPSEELNQMFGWLTCTIILAVIFVVALRSYLLERDAVRYLAKKQKEDQEVARRIAMRTQSKSDIPTVEDDIWKTQS